jgi:hypothetical protein
VRRARHQGNDFIVKEQLYRFTIKERRPPALYLPIDLDEHLVTQITSEHLTKRKLPDGRNEDIWQVGDVEPHLGDTLKEGIALSNILEAPILTRIRIKARRAASPGAQADAELIRYRISQWAGRGRNVHSFPVSAAPENGAD